MNTLLFSSCPHQQAPVSIEYVNYEGRPHYLVRTGILTYYYDKAGGGFSRIIDPSGADWIHFRMEPWDKYPASAASSYRGLPNLVFRGDDGGAGHPGWDKCRSDTEDGHIITESLSGKWKWTWTFGEDHAILDIQKADPERSYWFLYEGTPGGSFKPAASHFGTSRGGPLEATGYDHLKKQVMYEKFQWIYTGSEENPYTFYLLQQEADSLMDMASFLGSSDEGLDSPDGMTVFGFGRAPGTKPLLRGPERFVIGIYPETIHSGEDHRRLEDYLSSNFIQTKQ